ncbi:hypothetical protein QAD02_012425 [Eretmocerus hayati]|uniref:Uncharacterized protein n=1 Tax=Eretmocerus hayati TaxID=131215 RepID=A0ACC2P0I8_9HYME|nr:hypothetical protein QAD02_012425 [Eretmocerus hayati]
MFACNNCTKVFGQLWQYNKHQKQHDKERTPILCLVESCGVQCWSYTSFKQHVLRHHKPMKSRLKCLFPGCGLRFDSKNNLLMHMKSHKNHNALIECPFCTPKMMFLTMKSYHSHVFRKHRRYRGAQQNTDDSSAGARENDGMIIVTPNHLENQLREDICDTTPNVDGMNPPGEMLSNVAEISCETVSENAARQMQNNSATIVTDQGVIDGRNETQNRSLNVTLGGDAVDHRNRASTDVNNIHIMRDVSNNTAQDRNSATKSLEKTMCQLAGRYIVKDPAIQLVVENVHKAMEICKSDFASSLHDSRDLTEEQKESVENLFNKSFHPFAETLDPKKGSLRNTYQRKMTYERDENYVKPVQKDILSEDGNMTGCHFTYVPPLQTLSVMLRHPAVRRYCAEPKVNNTHVLFDIHDGKVIKENPFFQAPNRLILVIFQDGLDICCPIGPAKTKYKLNAVFMTLLNLPPHLRTKVKNIKLVQVCHEKYIKQFGWAEILRPLMSDLAILEQEGIDVDVNGVMINYKGSVGAKAADNLGSHDAGGYQIGFSLAEFFCRFCEITRIEFWNNPCHGKELRTVASYNACAAEAEATNRPCKGIISNSVLNKLNHYHVAKPGLPPCIDHDVNLGIVPYDMVLAIRYFMQRKWFKLGFLNYRLRSIKLMKDIIIPTINITPQTKRLVGSMAHMSKLILIFPLAIMDRVRDFADPVWEMVLTLRRMHALMFAPAISVGQTSILHSVTQDYMLRRQTCFPGVKRRPKHEYTSHAAELDHEFGPIRHLSTKHFETKNGTLKQIIKNLRNFKNVTKTIAERHELLMLSYENDYDSHIKPKHIMIYEPAAYDPALEVAIQHFLGPNQNVNFVSENLKYRGINYVVGDSVCVGMSSCGNFVICKIAVMLLYADLSQFFFVGYPCELIEREEAGVFEVSNVSEELLVPQLSIYPYSSLLSPDPILETRTLGKQVFLMKYTPYHPFM